MHGLMIEDLAHDVRVSLRGVLRRPLMGIVIVATVGLGIGATTTVFSAVNAALLRPLPYADPDRLVRIYADAPPNRFPFSVVDYLAFEVLDRQPDDVQTFLLETSILDRLSGSLCDVVTGGAGSAGRS